MGSVGRQKRKKPMNLIKDWTRTHRMLSLDKMWRSFTDWGELFFADTTYLDYYSVELKELNACCGSGLVARSNMHGGHVIVAFN